MEGFFTANADQHAAVNSLKISGYAIREATGIDFETFFSTVDLVNWVVWITGSDGMTLLCKITGFSFSAFNQVATFTVALLTESPGVFSPGRYQILFTPLISQLAPLDSPALAGSPTAPTQTRGDNSVNIATTNYVDRAVADASANYDAAGAATAAQTAAQAYTDAAIAAVLSNPTALAALMSAAGVTPVDDGTVTPVSSVTTKAGILTALA